MQSREAEQQTTERGITLLLADDDARMRSLVTAAARGATNDLAVLEAVDGAEAIQLGLQQQPQLALLDIDMPRAGGIEVALVLHELLPPLRLALYSGDTRTHRERVQSLGLPLFDKSNLDGAVRWVSARTAELLNDSPHCEQAQKHSLICASCGYGVRRSAPPRRCPMCHTEDRWLRGPSYPIVELA